MTVRDSYSRASITIIRSHGILSGVISARVRRRGVCNNMIPRVTSHHRARTVSTMYSRTLGRTNVTCYSVRTITIAFTPNLVNTLLINMGFTGKLSVSLNIPLVPIRRLESRVTTGCLTRPNLGPPFLYLLISNNGAIVTGMDSCARFRVVNRAHSSTTNRYFSGITHRVKLSCPNNIGLSGVTAIPSLGGCPLPAPGMSNKRFSFDFSNLGATMVGLIRGTGRGNRRVSIPILYTAMERHIYSLLVGGALGTTGRANLATVTITNKISTGDRLQRELSRRYGGRKCSLCCPPLGCYNSGTTVMKTRTICRCLSNGLKSTSLGTATALPVSCE